MNDVITGAYVARCGEPLFSRRKTFSWIAKRIAGTRWILFNEVTVGLLEVHWYRNEVI